MADREEIDALEQALRRVRSGKLDALAEALKRVRSAPLRAALERASALAPSGVVWEFEWRGLWDADAIYQAGNFVQWDGSTYITLIDNRGSSPPADEWDLIALKGQDGVSGAAGAPGPPGPGGSTVDVADEGVAIGAFGTVNFIGAGVTAVDAGGGQVNVTIPGGGVGSGHTIREDGADLPVRTGLNFAEGVIATDDAGGDESDVSVAWGAVGYPVDVAAAEADGAATTVPRADHVHAHGSGYLPDAHHDQVHDIDGPDHNGFPGGTTDFLRADGTFATPPGGAGAGAAYTWQSTPTLAAGSGQRFYADRDGTIDFCRAERSAGDGSGTATLDLLLNGVSIFPVSAKPTVGASTFLGPERVPDTVPFVKGDYFQVEIEAVGGGSGPLRLTTHFS